MEAKRLRCGKSEGFSPCRPRGSLAGSYSFAGCRPRRQQRRSSPGSCINSGKVVSFSHLRACSQEDDLSSRSLDFGASPSRAGICRCCHPIVLPAAGENNDLSRTHLADVHAGVRTCGRQSGCSISVQGHPRVFPLTWTLILTRI